jgi:hypothetical protein
MANNLSDVVENDILIYYLTAASVSVTRPSAWFLGLQSNSGTDESNAAWRAMEVTSGSNYVRLAVGAFATPAASTGSNTYYTSNSAAVSFVSCGATAWGNISYISVWDSSATSGGNLLFWSSITAVNVTSGDTVTVAVGAVRIDMF